MDMVVPKDLPLGLPAPFWLLEFLVVFSYALHILFVNLMLGASLLSLVTEIMGLRQPDWDRVSRAVGHTITANKSLAVVLGVAPLLTVSVMYTMQFYSANALTGPTWILIVPLVIVAFLLGYLHKYTWDALAANKGLHIAFVAGATGLFLFIPLIFLSNINLMLYPEHWRSIGSFLDAVVLDNVIPRYFHFLAASIAVTGLFLAVYMGRASLLSQLELETLNGAAVKRFFYAVAFGATLAQFLFGPLLFLTLPAHSISTTLVLILALIIIPLAALASWWLWLETRAAQPGGRIVPIALVLSVVVAFMAYSRHDIRETALEPHRALMQERTAEYMAAVRQAQEYVVIPGGLGGEPMSPGAQLFQRSCSACHAPDRRMVGPSLALAAEPYEGDPAGIVEWALNPGRRRQDYPPMPAQDLPRADLELIANYILEETGKL